MLRFIFGKKDTPTVKTETQRESFERVMAELNELIADQPVKPSLTVDFTSGRLSLDLPEQLADEALALPAPAETQDEEPVKDADESEEAADADAAPEATKPV
ncbi:hypothetical protein [Algirhabdus cladophorae]|uniref:hypothetical protein n=1 Tax=Algirhabdus cladophorae TaxID=3377108 RepID=UPI003B84AB64